MRRALLILWLLVACIGCRPALAPSLVIISVDTLRSDRLGAYGHRDARTPVIDDLARRGVRFEHATTPLPRTTPALASMLTGLSPRHHGSREVGEPLQRGTTLAELLRGRGYSTIGVSANKLAGPKQNMDRGFEAFRTAPFRGRAGAASVTDEALALSKAADGRRPLFLWAHYMDPHFPYTPPPGFVSDAEAEACRRLLADSKTLHIGRGLLQSNFENRTAQALPSCARLYDAEIAYVDREIGRLLEGLRSSGRLSHAYVVFTSDHGENLGEAGLYMAHGPSVHDASVRIPLLILGPGIEPAVDAGVIRLEDLHPTVMGLLDPGHVPHSRLDGYDLSARLLGRPESTSDTPRVAVLESGSVLRIHNASRIFSGRANDRYCFHAARWSLCSDSERAPLVYDRDIDPRLEIAAATVPPAARASLLETSLAWSPGEVRERAARTPHFKLVETPRPQGGWRRALYDLRRDPMETSDVSAEHPDVLARLGKALDEWAATPVTVAPEGDVEALRALGYIE